MLADEVMVRAGFANAAAALGLRGAARLTLEQLVMAQPFLIRSQTIAGGSTGRAYETGRHPALIALTTQRRMAEVADRWQTCGTPFVVEALRALVDARLRLEGD
jgi:iron complex transport system substrate-binding protein